MKKPSSSDSFGRLQEKEPVQEKGKYEDRFQTSMMDGVEEVECEDEELCSNGQSALGEKKRRLSVDQVKTLEKSFDVENKLDPDRKTRLAQDLGLQPRQVAIWFQNRRARWKTKQLERDYSALRTSYETLKIDCDALRHDKEKLTDEVKELKAKLANSPTITRLESKDGEERPALIYRDGASDSDSSVVFNDENSPYSGVVLDQDYFTGFKSYSSPSSLFESRALGQKDYLEEGFLSGEELCGALFSEDQEASLSWYCSEGWE